jgi:hypothetical protein
MQTEITINQRIAAARANGWEWVPDRFQNIGLATIKVREGYWYHRSTGRHCHIAAQLPDYPLALCPSALPASQVIQQNAPT